VSYDENNREYLTDEQIDAKLAAGIDVVSVTFLTPYPPRFPVLVPGQVSASRSRRSFAIATPSKSTGTSPSTGIGCTPGRPSRSPASPTVT
jgi:arginine/lysine/ornithine decarboxylase